jgi:hypothetical protein
MSEWMIVGMLVAIAVAVGAGVWVAMRGGWKK